MPMTEMQRLREVTADVVKTLGKETSPLTLDELLAKIKQDVRDVTRSEVRGAVVRLLDSQEVELTENNKVRAVRRKILERRRLREHTS